MPQRQAVIPMPEHRPVSLRVYPSATLSFEFPVFTADLRVHPKLRVLDLACDLVPDECVDRLTEEELTLVFNGEVLDGEATLGDVLFPRLPIGKRTTVVMTPMVINHAA